MPTSIIFIFLLIQKSLIIPHYEICFNSLKCLQNNTHHNQNACSTQQKRLNTRYCLNKCRHNSNQSQKSCPYESYSCQNIIQIGESRFSRPNSRNKTTIFLNFFRNLFWI